MEKLIFNEKELVALYNIFCGLSKPSHGDPHVTEEEIPDMDKVWEKILLWGEQNIDING